MKLVIFAALTALLTVSISSPSQSFGTERADMDLSGLMSLDQPTPVATWQKLCCPGQTGGDGCDTTFCALDKAHVICTRGPANKTDCDNLHFNCDRKRDTTVAACTSNGCINDAQEAWQRCQNSANGTNACAGAVKANAKCDIL